jgi:hypothetical protein
MDQNFSESSGNVPNPAESFGTVRKDAESFGSMPNATAPAAVRQPMAARTENHTMTVREAARAFENAGVARTERSITNWCQPNSQGISRLDAYFDPNDRRYYITPQSVERAIHEELAKARELGLLPNSAEAAKPEPVVPPQQEQSRPAYESDLERKVAELELKNRDLEIASRVKDELIKRVDQERERLQTYQEGLVTRLVDQSRMIGSLETQLKVIESPRMERAERTQPVPHTLSEIPPVVPSRSEPIIPEPQVEYPPAY